MNIKEQIEKGFERIEAAFSNRKELTERINALEATVAERDATIKANANAIATADTENGTLTERVAELEAEVAGLKAELENANAQLNDPEGTIQREAGRKAASTLAGLGVDPEQAGSATAGADSKSAYEQFRAIKDPVEATKFFRANRDKILACR